MIFLRIIIAVKEVGEIEGMDGGLVKIIKETQILYGQIIERNRNLVQWKLIRVVIAIIVNLNTSYFDMDILKFKGPFSLNIGEHKPKNIIQVKKRRQNLRWMEIWNGVVKKEENIEKNSRL